MLQYDRIDSTERIAINKIDTSEKCKICHY